MALDNLVAASMEEATLWVFERNTRARRFYEAHGWSLDGMARNEVFAGRLVSEVRYRRAVP